jgi:hypothetical protein
VLRKRSDSTTCFVKSQSHQHRYFKGFGGFFFDFAAKVRIDVNRKKDNSGMLTTLFDRYGDNYLKQQVEKNSFNEMNNGDK